MAQNRNLLNKNKIIDQQHAAICTDYYQKSKELVDAIKLIEQQGSHTQQTRFQKTVQDNIEIWIDAQNPQAKIEFDQDAKVYSIKYVSDPTQARPNWAGTDGSLLVKILEDDSYDYIKTSDLARTGLLMIKAFKMEAIKNKYYANLDAGEQQALTAWLAMRMQKFQEEINAKCYLDIEQIRKYRKEEKYKKLSEYCLDKIEEAELATEQLLTDLVFCLKKLQPAYNKIDLPKVVQDLHEAGIEYISKKGRPNVIKISRLGEDGHQQLMVSAQMTQGDITLPSSNRYRQLGDPKYLSNHINDFTGHIVEHANGQHEVIPDFTIDGHSSNPPIQETDELKRRYIAFLALKEEIGERAKKLIDPTNHSNEIIAIPISTMMLVTPFRAKQIEKIYRPLESEHGQLADTYWAYQMIKNTKQPMEIEVKINGVIKKIAVKADLSLMNLPVNAGRKQNILARSELQQIINKKGFNEYLNHGNAFFNTLYSSQIDNGFWHRYKAELNEPLTRTEHPSTTIDRELAYLASSTHTYYYKIENDASVDKIKNQLEMLNKIHQPSLQTLYRDLEKSLLDYTQSPTQKQADNYERLKEQIRRIERPINEKEKELHAARIVAFKEAHAEFDKVRAAIDVLLLRLENKHPIKDTSLRDTLATQKSFLETQELFYTESYLKRQNAYRYQARYLMTNRHTGRFTTSFCKSNEDRTGHMRTTLFANIAFYHAKGKYPDLDNPDDKALYDKFYAAKAMEASASIENTEFNADGARGLQIGSFTNPHTNAEIGKANAGMAKKPAKKLIQKYKSHPSDVNPQYEFDYEKLQSLVKQDAPDKLIEVHKNQAKQPIHTNRPEIHRYELEEIHDLIKYLREQDFDYSIHDEHGKKILVKDNRQHAQLNPIHPHEGEVQALRYLRGMRLIHDNSPRELQQELYASITRTYETYLKRIGKPPHHSGEQVKWLYNEFANILNTCLKITKGNYQLTMARDLGILLEVHPGVMTISEKNHKTTVEKSTPIQISRDYYRTHFKEIHTKPWFMDAKKKAGFTLENTHTWFDNFFYNHYQQLKELGTPATPSSRWLPLPANNQRVETIVYNSENDQSTTNFIRMGIVSPYDVDDSNERKKLGELQLREIIKSQIETNIAQYYRLYNGLVDPHQSDFYISYQTLLTPHQIEAFLPYKDNNARFVNLAKEVVNELAHDQAFLNDLKNKYHLTCKLHFTHTNASINHRGDWLTATEFDEDKKIRLQKIETAQLLKAHRGKTGHPALENEIIRRINASEALKNLLDNKPPYSNLNPYQRNIMIAALEFHTVGNQGLTLAGCKSARDRTAIFAAAVKVMQENREAMSNWDILNKGIILSLQQGHHFRSMISHSIAVKVSDVHEYFMKQLPSETQNSIEEFKPFSKKISKYTQKEIKENWEEVNQRLIQYEEKAATLQTSILNQEQREAFDQLKNSCFNLKSQLGQTIETHKKNYPNQPLNEAITDMMNRLDALINKKGKIVIHHDSIIHVNKHQDIPNRIEQLLHENDIVNPQQGIISDAELHHHHGQANNIEIKYSSNEYIIGKHIVKTVAVPSEQGHQLTVHFDHDQIKYLVKSNSYRDKKQDVDLKLLYEAIDRIELFRKNYAKGLLKELYQKNLPAPEREAKAKKILEGNLEELEIKLSNGFPPKEAKLMACYCAVRKYQHLNLVPNENGTYDQPSEKEMLHMRKQLEKFAHLLPDPFTPASLQKAPAPALQPIAAKQAQEEQTHQERERPH